MLRVPPLAQSKMKRLHRLASDSFSAEDEKPSIIQAKCEENVSYTVG